MKLKEVKKFLFKKYPVFTLFGIAILLAVLVSISKFTSSKQNYVYAKVKVDQGLWWIRSQKPSYWYANAIKKGEVEYSLLRAPVAEVLSVRYYPYVGENEQKITYDIFLTVKLAVEKSYAGVYSFKRSPLDTGSPIDLELPSAKVIGSIIEISEEPYQNNLQEIRVTLTKRLAFPWEANSIQAGDTYFDGTEKVVEIINKKSFDTYNITPDTYGNLLPSNLEKRQYIELTTLLKVAKNGGKWVFGEEQVLKEGGPIYLATENALLSGYVVSDIKEVN